MQSLVNIAVTWAELALLGVSFVLIFATARFFHFAHAGVITVGAYGAYWVGGSLALPLPAALVSGVIASVSCGCMMELLVYRPIRKRGGSSLSLLFASLGIYVIMLNLIYVLFGPETKTMRAATVSEGVAIFGARLTGVHVAIIGWCVLSTIGVQVLLKSTKLGKAMRAVASDSWLAQACGIDGHKVILASFILGSALAGVAGVLIGLDLDVSPSMGLKGLMVAIVAMMIGGVGSPIGVLLGALLLAVAQHLAVWYIGSEWQDPMVFGILIVFLLCRPQGFLGRKPEKASV